MPVGKEPITDPTLAMTDFSSPIAQSDSSKELTTQKHTVSCKYPQILIVYREKRAYKLRTNTGERKSM